MGEGQLPVGGIRPSDAIAFCRWLADRSSGSWQYRLPNEDELQFGEITQDIHMEAVTDASYWYLSQSGYQTSQFDSQLPEKENSVTIIRRFEDDWDLYDPNRRANLFEQVQKIILVTAQKRNFKILDLDRNLDEALKNDPSILQDLRRIRNRDVTDVALELDRFLEQAIGVVNDPNLSAVRNIELKQVLSLARELHKDLVNAQDLELPRGLTQEILRSVDYANGLSANQELVMYQELDRALNNALRLTRDLSAIIRRAYSRARTRIRANLLAEIAEIIDKHLRRKESGMMPAGDMSSRILILVDLYIDMALLEERVNGHLPAFEGIRLVRFRP